MKNMSSEWNVYRTRFLIKAKQLTEPVFFVDGLGREHSGRPGDYLVESSDGSRRIAPKAIFEDVYVAMEPAPPVRAKHSQARPMPLRQPICYPRDPHSLLLAEGPDDRSAENGLASRHPGR